MDGHPALPCVNYVTPTSIVSKIKASQQKNKTKLNDYLSLNQIHLFLGLMEQKSASVVLFSLSKMHKDMGLVQQQHMRVRTLPVLLFC